MRLRSLFVILLACVAACQNPARRLLLVDLTASDPLALDAIAAPWHDAGYHVEFRRFYPHLTRADLAAYRTIVLLGGREPEALSDALTVGDLIILNEWLRRDGVVVLGYTDGALDRWTMNQWLASQGAGIVIGPERIDAPAQPLPQSALDDAGFESFPAGRNRPLAVRARGQALARGPSNPIVAASRADDGGDGGGGGLIVVASKSLLGSAGADPRTRDFLVALARWTRRPAEWASVAAASQAVPLRLATAPQRIRIHPPPLAAPAGATVTSLPEQAPEGDAAEDSVLAPRWITRQGMRVLWARFTPQGLDSLLRFVDVAALNTFSTLIPIPALADTVGTRNLWKVTVDRLQATSVKWFPAISLAAVASQGADEVDRHGDLVPIACGLDTAFWRGALRPLFRQLVRLGGARPDVLGGVALDLDSTMTAYRGSGFCDTDYRIGLAALALDSAETARLAALPPVARYDTLLERGYLNRYFDALSAAVAERAVALRGELRRLNPEARFAVRASDVPSDWFTLGLLRGLSSREDPVLLWLRAGAGAPLRREYRSRGIFALSAGVLVADRATLAAASLAHRHGSVFDENAGFWLDGAASDSLGRVIRRFAK